MKEKSSRGNCTREPGFDLRLTRLSAIVTILVTMVRRQSYTLVYAPQVRRHLRTIERHYYSLIRETVEEQLQFEPDTETRNRKPLRQPAAFEAQWELRFGPANRFRVFYEIDQESRQVNILAIGVKERERLFIGEEEVEL
jgi:mRNA-degrading endonuclease RelE of RelBE toxin-antitoxin system